MPELATSTPEANIVEHDGLLIDTDTGEIVGRVEEEPEPSIEDEVRKGLRRIARQDAKIASIADEYARARQDLIAYTESILNRDPEYLQLKAAVANCTAIVEKATKARNYWATAYESLFRTFALQNLTGKERSLLTPWGKIALRKKAARLVVEDQAKAVEWARRNDLAEAVKAEVLVSKIPTELKEKLLSGSHDPELAGFAIEPESDSVTVDTGVVGVKA